MAHSLRSFARLAGVSPATVSRVFSGSGVVAPETRERVEALAEAVGFRPSAIGRAVFGGSTRSVGVLLPTLRHAYFADIAAGIEQRLLADGFLPVLLTGAGGDQGPGRDLQAVQRLLDHRIDALIVMPGDEHLARRDFPGLVRGAIPAVAIETPVPGLTRATIATDDRAGAEAAGAHLVARGHRRIGFVSFGEDRSAARQRQAGLQQALAAAGLPLHPADVLHLPARDGGGEEPLPVQLRRRLGMPDRPTALLAASDPIALEVYAAARDLGLRIPQDLAVAGFADLPWAAHLSPALTSVVQDGLAVGTAAAEAALGLLAGRAALAGPVLIPTRLAVRASTGG